MARWSLFLPGLTCSPQRPQFPQAHYYELVCRRRRTPPPWTLTLDAAPADLLRGPIDRGPGVVAVRDMAERLVEAWANTVYLGGPNKYSWRTKEVRRDATGGLEEAGVGAATLGPHLDRCSHQDLPPGDGRCRRGECGPAGAPPSAPPRARGRLLRDGHGAVQSRRLRRGDALAGRGTGVVSTLAFDHVDSAHQGRHLPGPRSARRGAAADLVPPCRASPRDSREPRGVVPVVAPDERRRHHPRCRRHPGQRSCLWAAAPQPGRGQRVPPGTLGGAGGERHPRHRRCRPGTLHRRRAVLGP